MDKRAKVSIIVPIYNSVLYISKCLDSLVNQTLEDIEIICVNDASTDNTLDILNQYKEKYPAKITIITHKENKRQGGARNTGIRAAKGEYIGFVDSDDWVELDMYEDLYNEASRYNLDIAESRHNIVDSEGNVNTLDPPFKSDVNNADITIEFRKKLLSEGGYIVTKVYKTSFLLDNNLFYPEGLFYEDNVFGELVYLRTKSYSFINKEHYHYFVNTSSVVRRADTSVLYDRFAIIDILKEHKEEFGELYKEEFEFFLIVNGISNMVKSAMQRTKGGKSDYKLLKLSREFAKNNIPDYRHNKYFIKGHNIRYRLLFRVFDYNIYLFTPLYRAFHKLIDTRVSIKKLLKG